jgi:hypothetical protein
MHRQREVNYTVVQRIRIKLGLYKYCSCNHCQSYGGTWRENHSSDKYVTPIFLRPLDDMRHYGEVLLSLWSS